MATVRLPPLPTVKDIIKLYKLRALKQLSQNFLLESRVTDKIVKAAGRLDGHDVCEVGPGPGSITRSILKKNPSRLILIEKDKRFTSTLEMLSEASPCPVNIYFEDILSFNMEKMFDEEKSKPWTDVPPDINIIGNLPFNISTPLIIRWLHAISERRNAWRYGRVKMTLTFQKEVAERMVSPILTKSRCRLSIMCQNWCKVEHKFTIKGKAFVPPPDVDVGIVTFEPLINPVIDLPFKVVEKVVRCLFSFRQKYGVRGIETLFPKKCQVEMAKKMFLMAGMDPECRPLMMSVSEIGRLCQAYTDIITEKPSLGRYEHRGFKKDVYVDDEENEELYFNLNETTTTTPQSNQLNSS